jgi:hypothetical protein
MSRARRLSEIAKANEPVFDSTGNQWWLADASAKKEQQTIPQPDSPAVPEPEPVAVAASASGVALQNGNPHISSANGAAPAPVAAQAMRVQARAEEIPDPTTPDLPSRLSGFKERFLWLGRKNRGE